ncbi:MAG: TolC family protein [Tannerella sp.]|jgi:outer membrane protein TolC|nr:TolC family protein [Tannerella sp.]
MTHKKLHFKLIGLIAFCASLSFFSTAQIALTIEQALDIAEENNPSMKTQKLNLERSLYNLAAQSASLKPQFSLTLNPFGYLQRRNFDTFNSEWYTSSTLSSSGEFRASMPILLTDGTLSLSNQLSWQDNTTIRGEKTINKAFTNNLNLRFDQPIFTYNRQKMALARLEYDHENAEIRYALQRLNTEISITNQFYAVYMAISTLSISQAELANAKTNYEIVKAKVEASLSAREELFQAEVNLSQAQSLVEQRTVELENAKDQFKQTLGMPLIEEITVIVPNIDVSPVLIDQAQAVQQGMSSRMELRQREIEMDLAEFELIRTKAEDEFSGNIGLQLGLTGDNEKFGNMYDNPTSSPRVAISFSIPIFDWGQRKARIQASKTAQTITKLAYENEKVDIELEIRRTLRNLDNYRTQIDIQQKSVENTQLTYDLNQIRYAEGDLTGLQISQYQAQLSNAQTNLVSARIRYKTEILNLKVRTLYDFENDKPLVPVRLLNQITLK